MGILEIYGVGQVSKVVRLEDVIFLAPVCDVVFAMERCNDCEKNTDIFHC